MSKGSRRKRATRPWQDASAMRNIEDLLAGEDRRSDDSDEDPWSRWDADHDRDEAPVRGRELADTDDSGGPREGSENPDLRTS